MRKIEITESIVKKVGIIAEEAGFEIYAVGGYVRDKILGTDSKDIDFVVVGDSIEFATIAAKKLNRKKVITYPRFKTAKIPSKSYDIEFVSARSEVYDEKSRKPIVTDATLESDLARRDFTINTLAVKINGSDIGQVIDCFDAPFSLKQLGDVQGRNRPGEIKPLLIMTAELYQILRLFKRFHPLCNTHHREPF